MKADLTEIIFLLDESSGVAPYKDDALKAIKNFVSAQKKCPGDTRMTAISFGGSYEVTCENLPINKMKCTPTLLKAQGFCGMLDAASKAIDDIGMRYSDTPEEERPSNINFVIVIFGRDNASKTCTYDTLREKIALQRDVYSWKFFLITDFTVVMEKLGIAADDTIVMKKDRVNFLPKAFEELCVKVNENRELRKLVIG